MKIVVKIVSLIAAVYILMWLALAAYFSIAERHKELLESNLSHLFKRSVSIEQITTGWDGISPVIQVSGFEVTGDMRELPALSFEKLSAKLDLLSILSFWPKFTDIAVEKPEIEISNTDVGRMQVAGIDINSNSSSAINPKKVITWLLNHEQAAWHEGKVIRRRWDGSITYYSDISFVYKREGQERVIQAIANLPDGQLAIKTISQGDLINSDSWGASLEVLSEQGQSLLGSDDFSLHVADGKGQLSLKEIEVQQIRDLLQLTGAVQSNSWILQSQLSGLLSNVEFDFSGAFLDFQDWSLQGSATGVDFESYASIPSMSNLNGTLETSSEGGVFNFSTNEAEFSWPNFFDKPLQISQASGQFEWDRMSDEKVTIKLNDGLFIDTVSQISNLNAVAEITIKNNRIRSLADVFKVDSIDDLNFVEGDVVNQSEIETSSSPSVFLDATADVDVKSLAAISDYFPNTSNLAIFDEWWRNAMLQGHVTNGHFRYQGDVTKSAFYDGTAKLTGEIDFNDLIIDFGYKNDWPVLSQGRGSATIDNSKVTFIPDEVWLGDDKAGETSVTIDSIFDRDRSLEVKTFLQTDLANVTEFLFAGPLYKPELRPSVEQIPIVTQAGNVDAQLLVTIPLNSIKDVKVAGSAEVTDGALILPQGVPVTALSGRIDFTENSAESTNIQGQFLGGEVTGSLATLELAQPPNLEFTALGSRANVTQLKPWIGEHILSRIEGETSWQGRVSNDGAQVSILVDSELQGVALNVPQPLGKPSNESKQINLDMRIGKNVEQSLQVTIDDDLFASFAAVKSENNDLLDRCIISIGGSKALKDGVNFDIQGESIDLDAWLGVVIDLATLPTQATKNTQFLDSMRSLNIAVSDPLLLGRGLGQFELSAISRDGYEWIGSLSGDNIDGILEAQPRAETASYRFNLSKLHLPEKPDDTEPVNPIDETLLPANYPIVDVNINSFNFAKKQLGRLQLRGEPIVDAWELTQFELNHQGISTTGAGQWVNSPATGTMTTFNIETSINEAGGALQELNIDDVIRQGDGSLVANVNWIGAPHEFDYSRLNGDFDLRIQDGELVNVEPGNSGKLLGLLNFNAIARRLTFDFRDIFASGLQFDSMRYAGIFADGQAIMQDAYIFTPAVFVSMEGKLDLDQELIDMEIHMSPELGGNLALLSALANPAAGAVVFLTQQIFKDEMRTASSTSFRALGPWDDFEMVEFDLDDQ